MLKLAFGLPGEQPAPYIAKRGDVLRAVALAGHGQAIVDFLIGHWDELLASWSAAGYAFPAL